MDIEAINFLQNHLSNQVVISFSQNDVVSFTVGKKRGNRSYDRWLYNRFCELRENISMMVDVDEKYSNTLSILLTYPDYIGDSWERVSKDVKRFLDSMRDDLRIKFADYFAVLESTEQGIVHVHLFAIFDENFRYIKRTRKNGKQYGYLVNTNIHDIIQSKWIYNITVSSLYYSKGAQDYLYKYFVKGFRRIEYYLKTLKSGGKLNSSEIKAVYGLYYSTLYNLRLFRSSRPISSRSEILALSKNNSRGGEGEKWILAGIFNLNKFVKEFAYHFGIDFNQVYSFSCDTEGNLLEVNLI